jgi:chloramphenicol-sensitive protein RarD
MNRGNLYSVGAYTLWGIFPIFWKLIQSVPALEIIAHRIIWTLLFTSSVLIITREWQDFQAVIKQRRILMPYVATAALLGINWFTYVWAVNTGFIVETSLGYFINPLVSVLFGLIFLKEKLRLWQWIPVALAFIGVLYLTIQYGSLPWIAFTLAFSFGTYGLVKKTAPLESLQGLVSETSIMFLPAFLYLLYLEFSGNGAFGHQGPLTTTLLVLAGVATGVPLLLFGAAARRIQLSTIGILQYIAPTLQFLIGVLVFGEDFSQDRVIGFSLIWIALLIYSTEGMMERRKNKRMLSPRSHLG